MGHVVHDVAKDAATVACKRCVPVVEEDQVRDPPEWGSENDEEGWWHDKAVLIHWKVMVDSVEEEMSS